MSTREEALATRTRVSEYHVYHEGEEHVCIIPFLDPTKEFGYNKKRQQALAADYTRRNRTEANSYFVHRPALFFHDPPRTLRRGNRKTSEPICIIHSAAFWREWTMQFGSNLPDIIDPRGLVGWEHRSRPDNSVSGDAQALKGYKVRTWRCWGESGKNYHRMVNHKRKTGQQEESKESDTFEPASAEEAVKLKWSSPLLNARKYHFDYAGARFFWEGTRDIPARDIWSKRLMPWNHLKLIAQVPGHKRMFVGYFTSSFSGKKFGHLQIFDSVLSRILEELGNSVLAGKQGDSEKDGDVSREPDIRQTRLYDLVMATSMCMIIGEWQKRITVWFILIMIAESGKGANMAGAGGGGGS